MWDEQQPGTFERLGQNPLFMAGINMLAGGLGGAQNPYAMGAQGFQQALSAGRQAKQDKIQQRLLNSRLQMDQMRMQQAQQQMQQQAAQRQALVDLTKGLQSPPIDGSTAAATPGYNPDAPGPGNLRQLLPLAAQAGPQGMQLLNMARQMNRQPERERAQDANGRWRYVDTGGLVFEDVQTQPEPDDPDYLWAYNNQTGQDERVTEAQLAGADPGVYAKSAPETATPADPFDNEAKLRGEFTKATKDFVTVRDAFGRVAASAQDPSAAGDLALIFNYMKVLDPGSTVREGEFATAQDAASVPERIRNVYNRVLSGQRLGDDQRKDFVSRAQRLYEQQQDFFTQTSDRYGGLARSYGLDPSRVVYDLGAATPSLDDLGLQTVNTPPNTQGNATPTPNAGVSDSGAEFRNRWLQQNPFPTD